MALSGGHSRDAANAILAKNRGIIASFSRALSEGLSAGQSDAEFDKDQQGAEAALVTAQRAWVQYRDGHCDAYGFQAHLGSMEPMLIYQCQAELTRARTKELKELADGQNN